MKRLYFALGLLVGALCSISAQPPMGGQQEDAETRAVRKVMSLKDTLGLTSEQFEKVYKVYYKEYEAQEQRFTDGMPMGGPGGGMPGGMMGGPGGMPGGGMHGGMPGGFDGGQRPPRMNEETELQIQKRTERRRKKMQKILSPEQYALWLTLDKPALPHRPNFPMPGDSTMVFPPQF